MIIGMKPATRLGPIFQQLGQPKSAHYATKTVKPTLKPILMEKNGPLKVYYYTFFNVNTVISKFPLLLSVQGNWLSVSRRIEQL